MATARSRAFTGGDNPEFISRNFGGMSNNASREAIGDEEFYWIENLMPLADGRLSVTFGPSAALATISSAFIAVYSVYFTEAGVNFLFVVLANGAGYVVNLSTNVVTSLVGSFTNAVAVPYNDQGLLILTPSNYYDWNITAANTLTNWNKTLTGGTITTGNPLPSTSQSISISNGGIAGGTGGSLKIYYTLASVAVIPGSGGTGYVVGDVITFTGGLPESNGVGGSQFQATVTVTAVSSGAISGLALSNAGSYAGPTTGNTQAMIDGTHYTGGHGTGAVFNLSLQPIPNSAFLVSPGNGYTAGTTTTDTYIVNAISDGTAAVVTITTSGIIGGNALAVFAGRVWLAAGRTIFVTEVNSFNNFGGSGTNFTIQESYLHGAITALCSYNNYLYIFGQDSIDAVSNVTVTSGLISFSRINLVTGVGTTQPSSVFGYLRGIFFQDATGFYLLAGATPERISEKIQGAIRNLSIVTTPVSGGVIKVQGELCIAVMATVTDVFSGVGGTRQIIFLYFKGRWWAYAIPSLNLGSQTPIVAVTGGNGTAADKGGIALYFWGISGINPALFRAFAGANPLPWIARTKLWDAGAPFREKQAYNAAIGVIQNIGGTGFTVDTEFGASGTFLPPIPPVSSTGYALLVREAPAGGNCQYLGLTFSGSGQDITEAHVLALRGTSERDILS